jgi:hypothetical protein
VNIRKCVRLNLKMKSEVSIMDSPDVMHEIPNQSHSDRGTDIRQSESLLPNSDCLVIRARHDKVPFFRINDTSLDYQ